MILREKLKTREIIPVLWLFALILSQCSSRTEEVEKLLSQYQSSVNNKDAEGFLNCFAPEYQDSFFPSGPARERIKQELNLDFPPSLEISSRQIRFMGDKVLVRQKFVLHRVKSAQARKNQGEEELEIMKGASGWRIVSGSQVFQILAGRDDEEDEIKAVLLKRIKALRDKNLELFQEIVDPEYDFRGKNFEKVIAEMAQNFRDYERIELILDTPRISLFSGRADVVEGFQLKVWYQGRLKEFNDTERLEFKKSGSGWKISKGL